MSKHIDARCKEHGVANIVSISGGKDSTAQWLVAIENEVPNIIPVFADTGHEHDITYKYVEYLEQNLGKIHRVKADFSRQIANKATYIKEHWADDLAKPIDGFWKALKKTENPEPTYQPIDPYQIGTQDGDYVWISARPPLPDDEIRRVVSNAVEALAPTGNPFIDLCLWKGRFPSSRARFCSFELKHEPIRKQIVEPMLDEYDEVISWQGVREQESKAREGLDVWVEDADNTPGLHVYRPIYKWKHEDVFAIAKRHGLDPNPLYKMGCSRVGRMPCIHVNKSELREIFLRFPEVIKYMDDMEVLVAKASKRGNATFFLSSIDPTKATHDNRAVSLATHGFSTYEGYALSTRGGRQFDLLADLNSESVCTSVYAGVCE
ncbi:phosphoadenosine phosphosulfate reductase family protein [Vibrio parahaemolyticus]|uniref:phosphoadenosine phosphosulfate reductase domain-containing protein n=1 Tax=Vibrio parahaemolyticus TaxID=670 RepID=UPI00209C4209|nr:phosphoadenosine phosphosulfate reductase family protein [Vibrio parahaemolyticus]